MAPARGPFQPVPHMEIKLATLLRQSNLLPNKLHPFPISWGREQATGRAAPTCRHPARSTLKGLLQGHLLHYLRLRDEEGMADPGGLLPHKGTEHRLQALLPGLIQSK